MWEIIKTATPQIIAAGIRYTIPLTLLSFAGGIFLGVITALIKLVVPSGNPVKKGLIRILQGIAYFYVWLFRSTPLLVQLFIIFFGLPNLGIKLPAFTAAVITFSLNTGAYSSETIRAALLSVPSDQWDAAYSLGMTETSVLWRIIFPQAVRIALPPLSNEFIGLVKDTSLASSITIVEMFTVAQQIEAKNYEPLVMYMLVAALYAVLCSVLSLLQGWLERRTSRYAQEGDEAVD
ncbi:amino acid ABC transporter permease [Lactobacillus selangorensis]|uniref:Amino acid ABC transporter permease n=1 Tax=Lactobacillus selangorensis TaxID=81857 RepID=A0A0R2FJ95_9LACO|nr:amino acid ABC transporter permease [Lactobacillus selangorensis]KRN28738.1 amino acid ABC transporter permease [Lactobacillus selangorensis]KRN32852.1 amino acid ABC transporter permease [Lactobacillus selangorensis]